MSEGQNRLNVDIYNTPEVKLSHYVSIIVGIFIIPLGILSNILVICGILLYPGFYNSSNIIKLAIAVFDVLMAAMCVPLFLLCYTDATMDYIAENKHLCLWKLVNGLVCYAGALYGLMLMSIDRYLAIKFPLKYHMWITVNRTIYVTVGVVAYSMATAAFPMFGWNNYNATITNLNERCNFYNTLPKPLLTWFFMIPNITAILISIAVNIHIAVIAFRQMRSFKHQSYLWTDEQKEEFKARLSGVKITLSLMCLFIIFTMPYICVLPLRLFKVFSEHVLEVIKTYTIILLALNSVMNGPVYAAITKEYRLVFWVMLVNPPWKWKRRLRKLYQGTHSLGMEDTNTFQTQERNSRLLENNSVSI
ncbi:adenosine receptor A1-like [Physella acuta]|uniref:adenosine receptor A1-like n=1 Tax=Physella acuta TaxID=109671 RepID=UPI0027DC4181|nr:adenosine receptor A1-like [Physella acuta]